METKLAKCVMELNYGLENAVRDAKATSRHPKRRIEHKAEMHARQGRKKPVFAANQRLEQLIKTYQLKLAMSQSSSAHEKRHKKRLPSALSIASMVA
jgi:hypothetical protein